MIIPKDLLSKQPSEPEQPFEGDIFGNRRRFAESLTRYINSLHQGAVLAIDAPWGSGKTWFGRHWKMDLEQQGYKCLYIDAFQHDYVGDPYFLLVSEMMSLVDGKEKTDLKDAAVNVGRVVLPLITKAAVNIAGHMIIGMSNLSGNISAVAEEITRTGADSVSQWLEQQLDAYASEKQKLEEFRKVLASVVGEAQGKPIVIFVDELDRCRPDFAVHLLEYLKHFFDVPNLVFVLLINRVQMEAAIRGIYGADCDASVYLGKFINLFITFPDMATSHSSPQASYAREMMGRSGLQPTTEDTVIFSEYLAAFATWFGLSFRQIEQAVLSYILSQWKSDINPLESAYLLTIKMAHPDLFTGIVENKQDAHRKAMKVLAEAASKKVFDYVQGATKQDIVTIIQDSHRLSLGEQIDDKNAQIIRRSQMDLPKHAAIISSGIWY